MKMQWSLTEGIAREKQSTSVIVPESVGKISDETL